jgi:hypothetical protein
MPEVISLSSGFVSHRRRETIGDAVEEIESLTEKYRARLDSYNESRRTLELRRREKGELGQTRRNRLVKKVKSELKNEMGILDDAANIQAQSAWQIARESVYNLKKNIEELVQHERHKKSNPRKCREHLEEAVPELAKLYYVVRVAGTELRMIKNEDSFALIQRVGRAITPVEDWQQARRSQTNQRPSIAATVSRSIGTENRPVLANPAVFKNHARRLGHEARGFAS